MQYLELASPLQHAAPLEKQLAERVLLSVLRGLASMLRGGSARAFAAALEFPLDVPDQPLERGGIEVLWKRVAHALSVDELRAREYVQITLAVLAQHVDEVLLNRLRRELPDSVEALLQRDPARVSGQQSHAVARGRSLADGKPGSRHPMSEAGPGSTHPVSQYAPGARQQHSVAESNPHAETKISSAAGLTQERESESLASGRAPQR